MSDFIKSSGTKECPFRGKGCIKDECEFWIPIEFLKSNEKEGEGKEKYSCAIKWLVFFELKKLNKPQHSILVPRAKPLVIQ